MTEDLQGQPIGRRGHNGHPFDVPWGFRKLLNDIRYRWLGNQRVPIYVTENGFAGDHEGDRPLDQIVDDVERQEYFRGYLDAMARAVKEDGIDVAGWFGWSLLESVPDLSKNDLKFADNVFSQQSGVEHGLCTPVRRYARKQAGQM